MCKRVPIKFEILGTPRWLWMGPPRGVYIIHIIHPESRALSFAASPAGGDDLVAMNENDELSCRRVRKVEATPPTKFSLPPGGPGWGPMPPARTLHTSLKAIPAHRNGGRSFVEALFCNIPIISARLKRPSPTRML
jgi:hypothetical protein